MLLLPELDTYHTLERFAKFPSRENKLSFYMLKRRAQHMLQWDAYINAKSVDDYRSLLNIRANYNKRFTQATRKADYKSMQELAAMPTAQRLAYMQRCVEAAGLDIDLSKLKEAQEPTDQA